MTDMSEARKLITMRRESLTEQQHHLMQYALPDAPGENGYFRKEPRFADEDMATFYQRLNGHIEECQYLLAALA